MQIDPIEKTIKSEKIDPAHPDQWMRELLIKHRATFSDSPEGWRAGIIQRMNELAATVAMLAS